MSGEAGCAFALCCHQRLPGLGSVEPLVPTPWVLAPRPCNPITPRVGGNFAKKCAPFQEPAHRPISVESPLRLVIVCHVALGTHDVRVPLIRA